MQLAWHGARLFLVSITIVFSSTLLLRGQGIVINEVMTSNGRTIADENGDTPDWIELYNASSVRISLSGFGLSDERDQPFKWRFDNATLEPHGFLVVFASAKDRQPPAVAPISPSDVAGLRVWLSADQIARTDLTQVRLSGANVFLRRWSDRSGHANHATQTDSARQPLFVSDAPGLSGKPALRFDGMNDIVRLGRIPAQNSFSLIAVVRTAVPHETDPESTGGVGGVAGQRYLFGAMHGGDLNGGAGLSVGTNGIAVYEHGSNYMPAPAVFEGNVGRTFGIVTITYRQKQPSILFQGNVVRAGLASPRATVTAPTEIGSGAYGSFQGEVAEILVYNRALEDNERRGIEEDLAQKYGLKLPAFFHTNFALSAAGERLLLTRSDGTLADELPRNSIPRDVSLGRQPDGAESWLYFSQATPGVANSTAGSAELLQPPEFSQPAGFWANAFVLTLSVTNRDALIRYTLDGSEPKETSPVYSNPMTITNRGTVPNKLSRLATVPGYQTPVGVVFKGTVVRAQTFKPGALPSATVTRSYFVHPKGPARYSVPVISLATDPGNFFDSKIGIYVPGTAPDGNYSQRGKAWERPVHVEFLETDGTVAFAQEGDVKIHGNTSQNFPIKGLDLDGTGGKGRSPFRHRIFPNRARTEFDHILLRPSGHDHHLAFMRDELMQSLAEEFRAETQVARLAVVFLNGEYWGLHYLKEKEDTEFVAHYGGTSTDNVDYLEAYVVPRAGETRHYDEMIEFIQGHSLSVAANYAQVQDRMEMASYIDYKVAEIFSYRWDIGNHRLWRPRAPEGRWRWLQFDNDVGWGGFWAQQPAWSFNMLEADTSTSGSLHGHNNETTTFLFRRLLQSESFKRDFINRFADLLNTIYEPGHTVARINQFAAMLEPEMQEHTARWRNPPSLAPWRNNVQYLRDFAHRRPQFVRQHLAQKFRLGGTATLSLSLSDADQGSLQLNTLKIAPPTGANWSGTYFKGNPITLSAVPAPGFRFKEWQGISDTANPLTLALTGDLAIKALFEATSPIALALTAFEHSATGVIEFRCQGQPNRSYVLEVSADLVLWQAAKVISTDAHGEQKIEEQIETASPTRFYRLRES